MTATSADPARNPTGDPVLVDARGMRCPWPVLRAARAMRQASRIVLLADDPVARTDVPALAQAQGWTCEIDARTAAIRFTLARAGVDPRP